MMAIRWSTPLERRRREEDLAWGMRLKETQPSPERIADEISDAYWGRMLHEDYVEHFESLA